MTINRLPIIVASVHLVLVLGTAASVYSSAAGQAALVWVFWSVVDFPVSLLYLFAPTYSRFVATAFRDTPAAHVLYLPHVVHGIFGTLWWFLIVWVLVGRFARRRAAGTE